MHTLYLNKRGDRYVIVDQRYRRTPMDFYLIKPNGKQELRRADFFESFGNFAAVHFRISGIRYSGLFEDFERINGYPVLRTYSTRNGEVVR
jgi:hypothetical protein